MSRVVTGNLADPWEVTWGPDGFLWITERVGKRVTRVNPADGSRTVAVTIDEVYQTLAQDGLLGSLCTRTCSRARARTTSTSRTPTTPIPEAAWTFA